MTFDEFIETAKTKINDYQYSPFMGSYLFFWIYLNMKMILIFFSDKHTIETKIDLLSYADVELILPLILAAIYTVVVPFLTTFFHAVTLGHAHMKKWVEVIADGRRRLSIKDSQELKSKRRILVEERDNALEERDKVRINYEAKEASLNADIQRRKEALATEIDNAALKKTEALSNKLTQTVEALKAKEEEYLKLKAEVDSIETITEEDLEANFAIDREPIKLKDMFAEITIEEHQRLQNLAKGLSQKQKNVISCFFHKGQQLERETIKSYMKDNYEMQAGIVDLKIQELIKKDIADYLGTYVVLKQDGLKLLEILDFSYTK